MPGTFNHQVAPCRTHACHKSNISSVALKWLPRFNEFYTAHLMRFTLGIAAICIGLALLWFALLLAGLGMFCFDGALFGPFSNHISLAPDCFVIGVTNWINPRIWLLTNLAGSVLLSIWAHATGYGLLRRRPWAEKFSSGGICFGTAYFAGLAVTLPEFRAPGTLSASAPGCLAVGCRVAQGRSTVA